MKLPPYVSIKNKTTYRYSRAYSIKIRRRLSQCPVKYDRTLQLKVGCSEAELNKALATDYEITTLCFNKFFFDYCKDYPTKVRSRLVIRFS